MKQHSTDRFDRGATLFSWSVLSLFGLSVFFFQGLEKPAPVSAPQPGPVTQISLEQLPIREEIQNEVLPTPEPVVEPEPEPEPKIVEPDAPAEEEPPPPEEPTPEPTVEPEPEPEAIAQEASTVEAGGEAVPPSLLQELQRHVEKAKYYPTRAKRRGITGRVVLRITISVAGVIEVVEIISSDHSILASAAKKTGNKLLGKTLSAKPKETLRVEVPVVYELR